MDLSVLVDRSPSSLSPPVETTLHRTSSRSRRTTHARTIRSNNYTEEGNSKPHITLADTHIPGSSSLSGKAKHFLHDNGASSSSSNTEDLTEARRNPLQPPPLAIPIPISLSLPKTTTKHKAHPLATNYKEKEKEKDRGTLPKDSLASKSVFLFPPITSALQKSLSSPVLHYDLNQTPPPYSPPQHDSLHTDTHADTVTTMHSESEDDDRDENDGMIYTSSTTSRHYNNNNASSSSLRSRIFGFTAASSSKSRDKLISTTPGTVGAGETETETDEPSKHLPTARIIPSSGPLIPPNTLEARFTPLLFEFSRLLSIVPAIFGTMYNLYHIWRPPSPLEGSTRQPPERVDYFVSAIWAILTGYQCLALATGLLTRWRLYYPPLSTLVRLLALQGICWPATHLTLTILEHEKRPVITWAVIGTTTCMSRSVQIWVTSNLWWEKEPHPPTTAANGHGRSSLSQSHTQASPLASLPERRTTYWKRWRGGGKWGGRRWDWREVGVKCVLPAGIVYFVMAWAEQLRREFAAGC